jgi:hypothetical protein
MASFRPLLLVYYLPTNEGISQGTNDSTDSVVAVYYKEFDESTRSVCT